MSLGPFWLAVLCVGHWLSVGSLFVSVWVLGVGWVPVVVGCVVACRPLPCRWSAGSGLPARSLLARPMLHDLWAAAAALVPGAPPPFETGMMWSAWNGSCSFGPCPHIQQCVAVVRMAFA